MTLNLTALNSATKYPSIPTYHALGDRGGLTETVTEFTGDVVLSEKIDGTNSRIVLTSNGDWFIGIGIVDALRGLAARLTPPTSGFITVFFLETYGARIGGQAKQYTGTGAVGHRMFDLAFVEPEVLDWDRERIASWRDAGGQRFATESTLQRAAQVEGIELAPRLATVPAEELPATIEDTHKWLAMFAPFTRAPLDESAGGQAEGIVLRTTDRSVIAKARFQDYERTLKRRDKGGK